jgi:hypothetical protein
MELVAIRRVILAVLLLGMTGLLVELTLLSHYEDFKQWIPLVVLSAGIVSIIVQLAHPREWTLIIVRLIMVLFIVSGLFGMYFHYRGSREFQLEMDPSMGGTNLVWKVLRAKSPPTLSPGMMVQMGILGLGYAYLLRIQRTQRSYEPKNLTNPRT